MNRQDYLTNKEVDILAPQTGDTLQVVNVNDLPNVNDLGMATPGTAIDWNPISAPTSFVSGISFMGGGGGGGGLTLDSRITPTVSGSIADLYPRQQPGEVITQDLLRSVARQEQADLQARVDMLNAQMVQMYDTIDRLRSATSVIAPLEGEPKANGDDI